MSQTLPDITVVLSVFNGGIFLMESVNSLLSQSFSNFELLVMDDASTDNSLTYLQSIKDERVQIYSQERNRSLFPCLNELIAKSRSTLIKLWSQDDIMNRDCLRETVAFHQQNPGIGFSYSDRDTIDEKGEIITPLYNDKTPEIISPELHARISLYTGSIAGNIANVCINKEAMNKVGLFHEEMDIAADFDMWVRLAREHDTGFINKKLVRLRDHKKQLSRDKQYHIRRPIEDMQVYNYLLSYVSESVRNEGLYHLRKYKFVYYYTLMVKNLMHLRLHTGWLFFRELWSFGGFFQLTGNFIHSKFAATKKPEFLQFREQVTKTVTLTPAAQQVD